MLNSGLLPNTFIPQPPTVGRVTETVVCLMTRKYTSGAISPLYHCRHSARDRQYECGRGI